MPDQMLTLARDAQDFKGVLLLTFFSWFRRNDGVVVRASASQSVDLGFIPLVESYQKTLKNGTHSFPAWRSAFSGGCGEQAGKLACVLGKTLNGTPPPLCGRQVAQFSL